MEIDIRQKLLMRDEGFKAIPYLDSEGNETIGIGWNIKALPMTLRQALYINRDHIAYFENLLMIRVSFYSKLDPVRQYVLINMAFNMGIDGLLGFKRMLLMMELNDFEGASKEMLNSKWAKQVGTRAERLSRMIATGAFPIGDDGDE